MPKRLMLAAVVYPMVNAVVFGTGATAVLSLAPDNIALLLTAIVGSFLVAAPLAWDIAPRLSLELSRAR